MIINRTAEFVYYQAPSNPGHIQKPLYLRNLYESETRHDRIEISENARKHYLEYSSSPLEKALLKALPEIERFRENLRKAESESDEQRSEHLDELKSKILIDNYHFHEIKLKRAAIKMISHLAGK